MSAKFDVAVLHDYFVDRLLHTRKISSLMRLVQSKVKEGGGGIHGMKQEDIRGGNAVNLAHALARLGLRTLLITHTDSEHELLLTSPLSRDGVEVRTKVMSPGLTVSIEGEANVMLGYGGGASDFGPERLDRYDWEALTSSSVVCTVNWAANQKGTELLKALRERLGSRKLIFFDPADYGDRLGEFGRLLGQLKSRRLANWISLNEREAMTAAALLGHSALSPRRSCEYLHFSLGVEIDVHTAHASYTCSGPEVIAARNRVLKARRLTGAGDVWNAGSIFGRIKKLSPSARLRFANAAASLYVSGAVAVPPSFEEVFAALR